MSPISQKIVDRYVAEAVASAMKDLDGCFTPKTETPRTTYSHSCVSKDYSTRESTSSAPPVPPAAPLLDVTVLLKEVRKLKDHLSSVTETAEKIAKMLSSYDGSNAVPEVAEKSTMTESPACADLLQEEVSVTEPAMSEMTEIAENRIDHAEIWQGPSSDSSVPTTERIDARTLWRRAVIGKRAGDFNVKGSKSSTKSLELFVFRVDRQTTAEDVRRYVEKQVPVDYVRAVSHGGARCRSFVMSIPMPYVGIVMSVNFWPQYIGCRRFVRPASGPLARCSFGLPYQHDIA